MDWQDRLITLFLFISKSYEEELCVTAERLSNNATPDFSDAEVLTVYLWGIMVGACFSATYQLYIHFIVTFEDQFQ